MDAWFTFALLSLLCCSGIIAACPALCQCYPRRAEVVCNEAPLTEFPSEGLPANTSLLTIQFTNITSISEEQLSALPHLQELHLYSNNLESLPAGILRGVPHLHTLDLTANKLTHLPPDVFHHASLRNLVLKNNRIENIDAKWFSDTSSLTWLDLSGNRLMGVPLALHQKLPLLENLDFSHNRLETILPKSLDQLAHLERLNLQNNKLSSLDMQIFQGTSNLTNLFLSENRLENLPPGLFQGLTKLKVVSLEDNQLSHIPTGLLDHLASLELDGLDLTANPWLCDQKVKYLWKWLQKNKDKAFTADNIVCAKPESLSRRAILSLTESELSLES